MFSVISTAPPPKCTHEMFKRLVLGNDYYPMTCECTYPPIVKHRQLITNIFSNPARMCIARENFISSSLLCRITILALISDLQATRNLHSLRALSHRRGVDIPSRSRMHSGT